jgi:hypothetical protein
VRVLALAGPLALAGFGAVGLLLADLGAYNPALVFVLGLAAFVTLYQCARPLLEDEAPAPTGEPPDHEPGPVSDDPDADPEAELLHQPSSTPRICSLIAAVFAIAVAIWNFMNAAQHAQINRDGGLYLNAGRWIAQHGTLKLDPFAGPFAHNSAVVVTSTGMKLRGNHLEFDLSHMLSAVLAEAHNVGGNRLMFGAVPILSGFALFAFYRLAARVLDQPVAALGATATLALLMPQVSFARDSTTEIPIQVLLFTALWMLCDRRTLRTPRLAVVAGVLLGLVLAMHIDGFAFVIGLPFVYAVTWLHTNRPGRKHVKGGIIWASIGVVIGWLFGVVDLVLWDRYYLSIVHTNVALLAAVLVVAIVGAFAVVQLVRRTSLWGLVNRSRDQIAYFVGAWTAILGFAAWLLRPHIQTVHGPANEMVAFVQRIERLPVDPTRKYAEYSMHWMSWYVGPLTLTLAILGVTGLAFALVRGGLRMPVRIATCVLAPPALLYTARPSITPDQIWATRRFLPTVFPVLVLLAWGFITWLARAETTSIRRSLAIVLGLATVVYPALTLRGVAQMTEQRNLMPIVDNACKIIGKRGAVVMLQGQAPKSVAYLSDPQTLRGFCNVPVAIMAPHATAAELRDLAARWRDDDRQLFAVDEHAQAIRSLFPAANIRSTGQHHDLHILEQTLTRRPDKYAPGPLQVTIVHELSLAPIPLPTNSPAPSKPATPTTTTSAGSAPSTSTSSSTSASSTTAP